MPKKYSEEERQSFCAKWKSSGKSKISFCKENGISESALHKWLMKLGQLLPPQLSPPASESPSPKIDKRRINFLSVDLTSKVVPADIASKVAKNQEVEILLPSGILLKTEVASVALLVRELVS